ncbi:hypothetical protein MTR_4g024590 [Medicago truncatula]|uniref:Uncharacterized protein n=1 Tax=Medicago truncatula TaxID=3880 RepID=G7JEN2_MEDTR|nr:hypothetical protein MTR_4g024590 [Medicago truncatula]
MLHNDPNHSKVVCYRWDFPNLIYHRHRLSGITAKISLDVTEKLQCGIFDLWAGYYPFRQEDVVSFSSFDDVLLALKHPSSLIIGVYGLSGVGNSSLFGGFG